MTHSSRLIHGVDVDQVALEMARESCGYRKVDLADGKCPDGGLWSSRTHSKAALEFEIAEVRATGKGVQLWVRDPEIRDQWIAWYAYWRTAGWDNLNTKALPADCPPSPAHRKHFGKPDVTYTWAALGKLHREDLAIDTEPRQLDIFEALAA